MNVANSNGRRVIAYGPPSTTVMEGADANPIYFESAWRAIMAEKSLTCSRTGKEYPAAPKPSFVMLDVSNALSLPRCWQPLPHHHLGSLGLSIPVSIHDTSFALSSPCHSLGNRFLR